MERTLAALKNYDAGRAELDSMLELSRTNDEVVAWEKAEQAATLAVQLAFYLDQTVNSLDNCKLLAVNYIRYAATGKPAPGSIGIGNVSFGRLIPGQSKWEVASYMGHERIALLRAVRDGQPLPEGLVLIGRVGGYVEITPEAINWAYSSVEPSDATLSYKVAVSRDGKRSESPSMTLSDARQLAHQEAETATGVNIMRGDWGWWKLHQIVR